MLKIELEKYLKRRKTEKHCNNIFYFKIHYCTYHFTYIYLHISYYTICTLMQGNKLRPKARGLAQHGGPPGWLEESDPACYIVRYGRAINRLPFSYRIGAAQLRADGISSCCYLYSKCTQASVTQGRHGLVLQSVHAFSLRATSWNGLRYFTYTSPYQFPMEAGRFLGPTLSAAGGLQECISTDQPDEDQCSEHQRSADQRLSTSTKIC